MRYGHNTVTMYFTIIGGLLLAGLILFAPWPLVALLVLVLTLLAMAALLVRVTNRRSSSSPPPDATFTYVPKPPMTCREERIANLLIPSSRADYSFLFSAMVLWSPMRDESDEFMVNKAALAVDAVVQRAREITEKRDPEHVSLVRHELARALATMEPDATGCLRAMAESVQLDLPDHDQQRLNRLAAVRKERAVWEHERMDEQSRRDYLGRDVLKDPGSAVVWWLAKNDGQVEKTVNEINRLVQLTAAANNKAIPETFHRTPPEPTAGCMPGQPDSPDHGLNGSAPPLSPEPSTTDHLEAFMRSTGFGPDNPERALLAQRLAKVLALHDRHDVADDIERRFDPADATSDPPVPDPAEPWEAEHGN